jgi:hypothetical protein
MNVLRQLSGCEKQRIFCIIFFAEKSPQRAVKTRKITGKKTMPTPPDIIVKREFYFT